MLTRRRSLSAGEMRGQMIAQVARVVGGPVDECGLAPAQERHAHQVHPRRIHNAAVVADPALAACAIESLVGNFQTFGSGPAGFRREFLLAVFQFPFRRAADRFDN